jgi:hypothetical protein
MIVQPEHVPALGAGNRQPKRLGRRCREYAERPLERRWLVALEMGIVPSEEQALQPVCFVQDGPRGLFSSRGVDVERFPYFTCLRNCGRIATVIAKYRSENRLLQRHEPRSSLLRADGFKPTVTPTLGVQPECQLVWAGGTCPITRLYHRRRANEALE